MVNNVSLFVVALVSQSIFAMDPPVLQASIKPPTITIGQYANSLVMGDDVDGWGACVGNVHAWLQAAANQNRISSTRSQLIEDLPFFSETLNPVVDKDELRCDYSLPVLDEDISRGPSNISVFRKASSEELALVKSLPKEDEAQKEARKNAWRHTLEVLSSSNVVDSMLFDDFKLETFFGFCESSTGCFTIKADFNNRNNPANICFLDLNDRQLKHLSSVHSQVGWNMPANPIVRDISYKGHDHVDVFVSEQDYSMRLDILALISSEVFQVNGDLNFDVWNARFKETLIQTVGCLTFNNYHDKNCYIKKIKIKPALNSEPMYLCANILFSERPRIIIECTNANSIMLKFYRPRKS